MAKIFVWEHVNDDNVNYNGTRRFVSACKNFFLPKKTTEEFPQIILLTTVPLGNPRGPATAYRLRGSICLCAGRFWR